MRAFWGQLTKAPLVVDSRLSSGLDSVRHADPDHPALGGGRHAPGSGCGSLIDALVNHADGRRGRLYFARFVRLWECVTHGYGSRSRAVSGAVPARARLGHTGRTVSTLCFGTSYLGGSISAGARLLARAWVTRIYGRQRARTGSPRGCRRDRSRDLLEAGTISSSEKILVRTGG